MGGYSAPQVSIQQISFMSTVTKYSVRLMIFNVALLLVCLIPLFKRNDLEAFIGSFGIFGTGLLLELFIGLVLLAGQRSNQLAKAILINVGVFFLIGFSVCSAIAVFS